jgi:hypothetical protein
LVDHLQAIVNKELCYEIAFFLMLIPQWRENYYHYHLELWRIENRKYLVKKINMQIKKWSAQNFEIVCCFSSTILLHTIHKTPIRDILLQTR